MIKKDNQCLGKIKYDTLEKASASSASMNKTGKKKLCAYKCSTCEKFHTGHNSRGSKLDKNHKKRKVVVDHEPGIHKVKNKFL